LCAGTRAIRPNTETGRQNFNIRKIQIYKKQAKTHAKDVIKITPKNNSIKKHNNCYRQIHFAVILILSEGELSHLPRCGIIFDVIS